MMLTRASIIGLLIAAVGATAVHASSLPEQLGDIAAQHHGKVALYAQNLKTGESVALNPDEPVPTASVIKLMILYEAMVQAHEGRARWDEPLTLTKANRVEGSGVLGQLDVPHSLTLKDALTLMVMVSDNTAANLLIDRFGIAPVNARARSIGLKQTTLYKKVFHPVEGPVPTEQPRFGLGRTTAREMAEVMRRIIRCELGAPGQAPDAQDREICAAALSMLRNQFYRDGIPRYIEGLDSSVDDSAVANKTGAVDAARNDVAAVATKDGTLILSIFTHDNADHSWSSDDEGDVTIAKLAKAIVGTLAPHGLDASKGF